MSRYSYSVHKFTVTVHILSAVKQKRNVAKQFRLQNWRESATAVKRKLVLQSVVSYCHNLL
jgi:hypothetical protein